MRKSHLEIPWKREGRIEAVLKIPYWDRPPADKGTNLLLPLSHASSTNVGFKEREGLPSELAKLGIPSIGSLTSAWLTLKALDKMS